MTRIVCISDTHTMHNQLILPDGDIIVHTGDFSNRGSYHEVESFIEWFSGLSQYKHKVLICGNHEVYVERFPEAYLNLFEDSNINYLNDTSVILEGLKFHGSPVTPAFGIGWAWNRRSEIKDHWSKIPIDTDVLLTHGPPKDILDLVMSQENVGCPSLLSRVKEVNPKLHVFGHLHLKGGQNEKHGDTIFVNAAVCNEAYSPINNIQVLEI